MKKGLLILFILLLVILVCTTVTIILTNTNKTVTQTGNVQKEKIISYNYKGKMISMDIPENWVYETNDSEDESLNYLIKVYPNKEDKEKYIVFNMDEFFGICGTGLEIKKDELNDGKTVEFGYYYNEAKTWSWSYVKLDEKEEFFAWNINLTKEEGETAIEMIKTLQYK